MSWRGGLRLALVLAGAVLTAQLAAVLLAPRGIAPTPVPVEAASYFSPAQIERAEAFRSGQTLLYLAGLLVELVLLAWLVRRPPRALLRAWRRPVLAAGAAAAALAVVLDAVLLPVRAVARERAVDVGLVTQSWGGWAADAVRAAGITAGFAAVGGALAVALMRRLPRRWWLPGAAVVVGFGAGTVLLGPVILDPIFNDFRPLRGPLREDVVRLAREAGVDVGRVQVMDASRRTTAANAYVTGLGATKRVVLYDTLLEGFPRDEVRVVVAHELGHVARDDLRRGLLYLVAVAPAGMLAAASLTRRLAPPGPAGPAVIPALGLALALLVPALTWVSNGLSREVEAAADAFALRATGDPAAFVSFERRITLRNVADPDPPALVTVLLRTHPTPVQRIGMAVAYARSGGDAGLRGPGGPGAPALGAAPRVQPEGVALVDAQPLVSEQLLDLVGVGAGLDRLGHRRAQAPPSQRLIGHVPMVPPARAAGKRVRRLFTPGRKDRSPGGS